MTVALGAAAAVARGPGPRAGALRADAQQAALVEPGRAIRRPAPIEWTETFGMRSDVLRDDRLRIERDLAAQDEPDVERRAADVGADDVLLAVQAAQVLAAEDAAGRAGVERDDRPARGVARRR